jgi:hypothetical protein
MTPTRRKSSSSREASPTSAPIPRIAGVEEVAAGAAEVVVEEAGAEVVVAEVARCSKRWI